MNIKHNVIFQLGIIFWVTSANVIAHSESIENGLEIWGFYAVIDPSYTVFDPSTKDKREVILPKLIKCYVYLENVGNNKITVIRGDLDTVEVRKENKLHVYLYILETSPNGKVLKPSASDLYLVELLPGETTKLAELNIEISQQLVEMEDFIVAYVVKQDLGVIFNAWSGKIQTKLMSSEEFYNSIQGKNAATP